MAGYDDDGPHLFQVDPSGTFFGWKATAIGKGFKNARSFLERRYREDMELEDAIHTVCLRHHELIHVIFTHFLLSLGPSHNARRI